MGQFLGENLPHSVTGGLVTFTAICSVPLALREFAEGKTLRRQKGVFA
jgi:hypothetical protein